VTHTLDPANARAHHNGGIRRASGFVQTPIVFTDFQWTTFHIAGKSLALIGNASGQDVEGATNGSEAFSIRRLVGMSDSCLPSDLVQGATGKVLAVR
jgi:hypothetical protein